MTRSLTGRVALVTGAAKGIGAGIAKPMSAAGASVVVNFAVTERAQGASPSRSTPRAVRHSRFKRMSPLSPRCVVSDKVVHCSTLGKREHGG